MEQTAERKSKMFKKLFSCFKRSKPTYESAWIDGETYVKSFHTQGITPLPTDVNKVTIAFQYEVNNEQQKGDTDV